jgi:filamentous hemagglutinin family protein
MSSTKNTLLLCTEPMSKRFVSAANSSMFARAIALLGGLAIAFPHNSALAQISPDETLGVERSVITPNVNIKGAAADQIDGGAIRGSNLFHSFREFNIGDGQRVYFSNPSGINNILGRVTGNNPSDILGTLGVNGNANLFLINPNGIIFGQNARLDVGGSFVASTANAIQFGEQGFFSATSPETPPLLTVNPSAFFFNQIQPGRIENRSTAPAGFDQAGSSLFGLRVPDGRSLLLLGGDVVLNGGRLNAVGGRVELAGIAGSGTVGLNVDGDKLNLSFPENAQRTDVSIIDGRIDVATADKGGSIFINAQNFKVLGDSALWAGIRQDLGTVNSQAGDINITAESVSLSGFSTIFNSVRPNAIGNGGNITIQAGSFSLTDGSELVANTNGQGNAGNITLQVRDRVAFDGIDSEGFASGIFNVVRPGATGNSGDIKLTAGSFSLTNGARLQTNTRGKGNAGNVIIQVRDRIYFDAVDTSDINNFTGIFTAVGTDGEGRGGDIYIQARSLDVRNGAQLTANTFEKGDAGNIKIEVSDRVSFDGVSIVGSSVASSSVGEFKQGKAIPAIGQGGNIEIIAKSLSVTNGAGIGSSTVSGSQGDAGKVKIVTSETAILRNGAGIRVDSQGSGKGGNIEIQAGSLTLDNQSTVSAETASNTGGNITLKLQDLLLLRRNSQISSTAGTAQQNGDGGNITINAPKGFIVASPNENSDITANAFNGAGGKIQINATGIFGIVPLSRQDLQRLRPLDLDPRQLSTSDITAVSQQNPSLSGTVQINTPDIDPNQSLVQLSTNLVDVSQQIVSGCTPSSQQSQSSFIATGRGGLPLSPTQPLQDTSMLSDWVRVQQKPATSNQVQIMPLLAKSATQIVEAQGWVVDGNGGIVLVAQTPQTNPRNSWQAPVSCPALDIDRN